MNISYLRFSKRNTASNQLATQERSQLYNRARYYDGNTGEFCSKDPLEYVDGMSLYRGYFVADGVDPSGLFFRLVQDGPLGPISSSWPAVYPGAVKPATPQKPKPVIFVDRGPRCHAHAKAEYTRCMDFNRRWVCGLTCANWITDNGKALDRRGWRVVKRGFKCARLGQFAACAYCLNRYEAACARQRDCNERYCLGELTSAGRVGCGGALWWHEW